MNPRFKKRGYFVLVFSVLVTLSLIFGSVYIFYNGLKPVGSEATLELKIYKGQGLKEIAAVLSRAGLIRSIAVFKLYVVFTGKAQYLKPGLYQFNGQTSVPEMIDFIIKGPNEEISVTIPEGTTVKEIDRILSSASVIAPGSLVKFDFSALEEFPFLKEIDNLEGFLYPDTYRFKINSSAEEVIKKLLSNFQEKIWPIISQKDNWYEVLILSSILVREIITFNDQQLVAGILEKRIKNNLPLQVDAAPVTYSKLGWPSAPIANMGTTIVQAALTPKSSNYWYYLSVPQTQETVFARTLAEHNKNINRYLK